MLPGARRLAEHGVVSAGRELAALERSTRPCARGRGAPPERPRGADLVGFGALRKPSAPRDRPHPRSNDLPTTSIGSVLADAGGLRAPRERAAQIRAELLDALAAGAHELALPRSGYDMPVPVAIAAFGEALLAIAPVDPALRADPNAANDRAWTLVALVVGALVEGAAAMAAGAAQDLQLRAGEWEGWLTLAFPVAAAEVLRRSSWRSRRSRRRSWTSTA